MSVRLLWNGEFKEQAMVKVLIVNQDVQIANLIGLALHQQGYQVSVALNAESGREQLALMRPDLLIISKKQIERDRSALDKMRTIHKCPLLLICDAAGSTSEALFRMDLIPFPFHLQELMTRVEKTQTVPHLAGNNAT